MSRIIKLAAAAIAIALTATIIAIVADDGRAAPQQRSIRYEVALDSRAPVVTGTVIALGRRPSCHNLTWRVTTARRDAR
jgi:hypothetical protein